MANLPERIFRFVGNRYYKVRIPNANLYELLTREIDKALKRDEDTLTFCERVGSEAYLGETLPCVLFIVKKFRENPQRAILEAVNYTWDSDTIASIVGAIMGAIYGKSAFRKEWIDGLSGRLLINGKDGVIFEMIDEVKSWLSS
ncbi:ADP-ribosylglycohydrolase family protein [Saccharolobus islandicus]|uniref:ADP-ribosylglycohydrolase family protein n=1 Tax=Saccharolobus islandicus TaxID=43080 RepID=UPI000AC1F22B|nr:ADP-ribosylglycohydrolase family protein [Sulfolobus islandicus]